MAESCRRAAVVTGSNKGIGFEIVKKLCRQFDGDVYLTSVFDELSTIAVRKLEEENLSPKYHQLDVTDLHGLEELKQCLLSRNNGLDILINNAGIMYQPMSPVPFPVQAAMTMQTNFWGLVNVCNVLFPILRPHARVVNISSLLGKKVLEQCSEPLQSQFLDPNLDMEKLFNLMNQFTRDAEKGVTKQEGWPEHAYGVSKLGVVLLSKLQQKEFDNGHKEDIIVSSCTPGWVRTEMGGPDATKSPEEGADTPTFLSLLPATTQRGKFWKDREVDEWQGI